MSKERKINYGFLLVGTGLAYLLDKLFPGATALWIAFWIVLVGAGLLISGELHRDKNQTPVKFRYKATAYIVLIRVTCFLAFWIYRFQYRQPPQGVQRPPAPVVQPPVGVKVTIQELEEKERQGKSHRAALFKQATPNEDLSHLSHDQLNIYARRNAKVLAERSYAWRNSYFTLDTAIRDFSDPRRNFNPHSEDEIKAYTAQRLKQKKEWADKLRTETRPAMKRVCGLQAQIFDRGLDPIEKKDVLPSARFTELCKSFETAEYSDLDVGFFSDYITQVAAKSEVSIKP